MRLSHLFWLTTFGWLFGTAPLGSSGNRIWIVGNDDAIYFSSTTAIGPHRANRRALFFPMPYESMNVCHLGWLARRGSRLLKSQAMGIKTVISVDGAKPNVELANRFGLRYVHNATWLRWISETRGLELAKAVRDLPGPIYIHCHHGKHRSPAAAAVACLGAGLIQADQANASWP